MSSHRRPAALAVLVFLAVAVGSVSADASSARPPALAFVDMPDEFVDTATWATNLFDEAGLDLPPLRFVYRGVVKKRCAGRTGLHHRIDGVNVIEICTPKIINATKGMILHETAHAWIDQNLSAERRAAFQELRGWTYWRDYEAADWHENGTEQAAEIMVWGLIDRPLGMIRIDQNSCDELDAGYRTLTGQPPLHGFRDFC